MYHNIFINTPIPNMNERSWAYFKAKIYVNTSTDL